VNLPIPDDCIAQRSECEDRAVLNQLDGFNMQPRISVPFDGEIDPASVNSRTVFLVRLAPGARATIGINQIVWDPASRELSFRPDEALEQHTSYALVVTTGVRDSHGNAIGIASGFRRDRSNGGPDEADQDYRDGLRTAGDMVRRVVRFERGIDMAVLSVFTTQSFSHVFERMRDAIQRAPVPALEFGVGPAGERAVFSVDTIQALTNNVQVSVKGSLAAQPLANALPLMRVVAGAVRTVAFGTVRVLDFTVHPSGHVAPFPTRTETLAPTRFVDVAFNLWIPAGAMPRGGWPVVMCAHGSGASRHFCFTTAAVLASHGLAVIGLNAMGHGGGPLTTMTVTRTDGPSITFAAPGLGEDTDGDGTIATFEPRVARAPNTLFGTAGPMLQTAASYLQLVRAIQRGVDVDGDGRPDLDRSRIYLYGHSIGGMYSMFSFAYEPAIRAAVFVVPAGNLVDNRLLSPPYRQVIARELAARTPSLINGSHGLTAIDGMRVEPPYFNENLPLRNVPPVVNDIPGAIALQKYADHGGWAEQIASAVAIAPLLRRSPPAGVRARPLLIQFARSDPGSSNPTTTQMLRAGDLADRAVLYRHDLNFGADGVPPGPHQYSGSVMAPPNYARIARGGQEQTAVFFESDGSKVIHPAPTELWEVPIRIPLPEDLFYLPRPRK
jgi:alpha-beta hydrolase superfamily lysophospholipase